MSYEAWGDDDDGLDGYREEYRKVLLEDGWLDDKQATTLQAERDRLEAQVRELREALEKISRANHPAAGIALEALAKAKP